jgi:hypothetical protein
MKMFRVMALAALGAAAPGGCINWQAAYDSAARNDCREIGVDDRSECLERVERSSSDRRAEQRRTDGER